MANNYVDNEALLNSLIKYREAKREAIENDTKKPRIPEEVGEAILAIANNFSRKPKFAGYTFRDDMVSDGVENCITYIDNFNPEISRNPFAYFTQIIYYAFLRRIQSESKQTYIKIKSAERTPLFNMQEGDDTSLDLVSTIINEKTEHIVQKFEEKMKTQKKKKTNKQENYSGSSLEDLLDADCDN